MHIRHHKMAALHRGAEAVELGEAARPSWRWAVLGLEVVLAAGCGYFGWSALHGHQANAPVIAVHRAEPPAPDAALPGLIPVPPAAAPGDGGRGAAPGSSLPAGLLERLSRDDLRLYKAQWRAINILLDGIREYIERRVVPSLHLSAN
jgi:hypothetical protein